MAGLFLIKSLYRPGKKLINDKSVQGALLATVINTRRDVLADFNKCIATWKHKPKFVSYVSYAGGNVQIKVLTMDKVFGYLDRGTVRRFVPMKRRPSFIAKTQPGMIGSVAGQGGPVLGADGKPFILKSYKARVTISIRGKPKTIRQSRALPGIKARNFSLNIRNKHEQIFFRRIGDALMRGVR